MITRGAQSARLESLSSHDALKSLLRGSAGGGNDKEKKSHYPLNMSYSSRFWTKLVMHFSFVFILYSCIYDFCAFCIIFNYFYFLSHYNKNCNVHPDNKSIWWFLWDTTSTSWLRSSALQHSSGYQLAFIEGVLQQKAFRCTELQTTIMHLKKPNIGSRAGKLQLHAVARCPTGWCEKPKKILNITWLKGLHTNYFRLLLWNKYTFDANVSVWCNSYIKQTIRSSQQFPENSKRIRPPVSHSLCPGFV